ncbi:hypothetical protein BP6252_01893 [Coleophoma cylindrospora]|uniref:Uncharacterized protein n=1 Tax=Coleophoma cylindrospora TaxID=1849047 RepID=A0A3D8SDB7_9HELO|nr:hypothetical protein BP6252_01893 [Coleophoma cylindrospora]
MATNQTQLVARSDCAAGTTFYICKSNSFSGCCSVDPCDLPSCPDATTEGSSTHPTGTLVVTANTASSSTGSFDLTATEPITIFSALPTSVFTAASSSTLVTIIVSSSTSAPSTTGGATLPSYTENRNTTSIAVTASIVGFVVIASLTFCFVLSRHHRRARLRALVARGQSGDEPTDEHSDVGGKENGGGIFSAFGGKYLRCRMAKFFTFKKADNAHDHDRPASLTPSIQHQADSGFWSSRPFESKNTPNLDSNANVPPAELHDSSLARGQPAANELSAEAEVSKDNRPTTSAGAGKKTANRDSTMTMWPDFRATSSADSFPSMTPKPSPGMSWAEYKYLAELRADGCEDDEEKKWIEKCCSSSPKEDDQSQQDQPGGGLMIELDPAKNDGDGHTEANTDAQQDQPGGGLMNELDPAKSDSDSHTEVYTDAQQDRSVGGPMLQPEPAKEEDDSHAKADVNADLGQEVSPILDGDNFQGGNGGDENVSPRIASTEE